MSSIIDYSSETAITTLFPSSFLDELHLYLGLDPDLAEEHQPISVTSLLKEAVGTTENIQWRHILPKTVHVFLPASCVTVYGTIYLPYNCSTLTSFTYNNSLGVATDFDVEDYSLIVNGSSFIYIHKTPVFEAQKIPEPVKITYTTGYSSFDKIPTNTLLALKNLCYHIYNNKEASSELPDSFFHLALLDRVQSYREMEHI